MNRFRTVGLKLTLALAGLVAGALAIVYLAVVPSLKDRLISDRQNELKHAAPLVINRVEQAEGPIDLNQILSVEAGEEDARLTVFDYLRERPVYLGVVGDSVQYGPALQEDPVAQRAAEHGRIERGVVERGGHEFAEVAVPFGGRVLLLGARIDEGTISLVERRLLLAGLIALVLAAVIGFALARIFARRIRRLERAAGRIAGGRFDEPVVDSRSDELGQLALAFDDMRKRLAALERARREFIANASHELRTPIFALGGHLELLTDEDVDPATRREFLGEMRLQVERLTKLATDLLDLSRLDAGRLRIELAPVDLAEIAGSLVGEFSAVGRGSDHVLRVGGSTGVFALADEERVRQIGRILVENAIVHTPPGTAVRVNVAEDGAAVALRVEDDGPGIAAPDREQVFDRFFRSAGTVKAGSGLGLAIARELAGVMGGEIVLESRRGRTVFTLRLPRAETLAEEREPALAR
ncbi:MAG TPA: HAMP domain-containing sensor histidine kinase [Gaiellaceae bacterium]|jgi:signal transduction histidine kinase|nr:HAMP domain-containing sensor histidine kinase [Gaiellaceae bacterium]